MKKRKVVYVSGTRADFGLMVPVLRAIAKSSKLQLLLYATGMHLMPRFGETIKDIRKLFPGVKRLNATFDGDSGSSMALFSARLLEKFIKEMIKIRPDIIIVLGDRVEMITISLASLYLNLPVAHIHGGERSMTVDEAARHAITKLSSIHFPATKESARRILKMGEEKSRVHVVGAPALDIILREKLPSKKEVGESLKCDLKDRFLLVTQHPVVDEEFSTEKQMDITLDAVEKVGLPAVIIYPNADSGGREMIKAIENKRKNRQFYIYKNIPYKMFLALERDASVWLGNSSALLLESPSFRTPVVNIGPRQKNRQRGSNVIDVDYNKEEIVKAIKKSLYDKKYLQRIRRTKNPWGDGNTGPRVAKILENVKLDHKLLNKQIVY